MCKKSCPVCQSGDGDAHVSTVLRMLLSQCKLMGKLILAAAVPSALPKGLGLNPRGAVAGHREERCDR